MNAYLSSLIKPEKIEEIEELIFKYEKKLPPCFTNKEFIEKLEKIIEEGKS